MTSSDAFISIREVHKLFGSFRAIEDVPPHHRPVNMVFQPYAIFPHLYMADNIAYGLRGQMQLGLRALRRQVGITFVFVIHDQEEVLTLSDRIAAMQGGKVRQVDRPAGLWETPKMR